jgi:Flp pilus assembly protein CpaB
MRSGRALIIVGVIVVLAGVIVAYIFLRGAGQQQPEPTPIPSTPGPGEPTSVPYIPPAEGMKTIVVAAQDIPRGTRITEANHAVKTASWPENAVPDEVLTDIEDVYGTIARTDIVREMPILEGMVTEEAGDLAEMGSDAALMIPRGRVAYALSVGGNASVAWAIQPGDHVDVLVSMLFVDYDEQFQTVLPNRDDSGNSVGRQEELADGTIVMVVPGEQGQRPRLVTQLTVQDAIVLRVGTWLDEEPVVVPEEELAEGEQTPAPVQRVARWVTLAVTPQDAAVLKYSEEILASMDFVLRSAADHDGAVVTTEAVTLQYVFDRFNIELPPKLPYGPAYQADSLRYGAAGEVLGEEVIGGQAELTRWHGVSSQVDVSAAGAASE